MPTLSRRSLNSPEIEGDGIFAEGEQPGNILGADRHPTRVDRLRPVAEDREDARAESSPRGRN